MLEDSNWQSYCEPPHACVEILKKDSDTILVRDSKDPEGGRLNFTPAELDAFATGWAKDRGLSL